MGGGRWDSDVYRSTSKIRAVSGVKDFAYSDTAHVTKKIHEALDPKRIEKKPFAKLESRDSAEHPESTAVLMCFDVTGSNISRAAEAQQKLPVLMELLGRHLPDVQVAVAANDDYITSGDKCIQISDFESDVRVDEHIRNTWLIGLGGGNRGESYDLLLYAAARKTIIDCFEKRGKKGYMFLYADEPFMLHVDGKQVHEVYGDDLQDKIDINDMITEVREKWNLFIIFPSGGQPNAYEQFLQLFGEASVLKLDRPSQICELVATAVGIVEEKLTTSQAVKDLKEYGMTHEEARAVVDAVAPKAAKAAKASKSSSAGTSRL
jgi:hypothetical protein